MTPSEPPSLSIARARGINWRQKVQASQTVAAMPPTVASANQSLNI